MTNPNTLQLVEHPLRKFAREAIARRRMTQLADKYRGAIEIEASLAIATRGERIRGRRTR